MLPSTDFSFNISKTKSFRNSIRVSNGLDPDKDRGSVGPDLVQYYLQMLSTDRIGTTRVKTVT